MCFLVIATNNIAPDSVKRRPYEGFCPNDCLSCVVPQPPPGNSVRVTM